MLIVVLTFYAMAGKLNVPYEPTVAFLWGLLIVTLGSHALTA